MGTTGMHAKDLVVDPDRAGWQLKSTVVPDQSYRDALGEEAWLRLRPEIRQRFCVKPANGEEIRYAGVMHRADLSWAGWLFAQVCRLLGAPLMPFRGQEIPMKIVLAPDDLSGGVSWERTYELPDRVDFTVRSCKIPSNKSCFIESLGRGLCMRLVLSEFDGNLRFRSEAYLVQLFGLSVRIPALLTPGVTTVDHIQVAGNTFIFRMSVDHPLLGTTVFQEGTFRPGAGSCS